jgi:hypothetical protein
MDRFYSQQNIKLYRKLFDRSTDEPQRRLLFNILAAQAHTITENEPLRVHVEPRGDKYIWKLRRDGHLRPVKFSAPIYSSEEAARASGNEVRKSFLARSAARPPRVTSHAATNRATELVS